VLLVIYFAEIAGDKELAEDLAARMESQNRLDTVDAREYKRLFDTVLDAKTAEGQVTMKEAVSMMSNISQSVQPKPAPMPKMMMMQ
jgi:hypothetical protein